MVVAQDIIRDLAAVEGRDKIHVILVMKHCIRSENRGEGQIGQRCIVVHNGVGALVEGNLCFDIPGHGIFLEDHDEVNNTISGNNNKNSGTLSELLPALHLPGRGRFQTVSSENAAQNAGVVTSTMSTGTSCGRRGDGISPTPSR